MRKIGSILIFIFLTGLFSGIFFSTNLSQNANDTLSALMLTSFSDSKAGFFKVFTSSLITNLTLFLIMAPAAFIKYLKPLPAAVLWYKSFAIGFCSGLVYINAASQALLISLVKILPQNLFIIPSFIIFAYTLLSHTVSRSQASNKRSSQSFNKKSRSPFYINGAPVTLVISAGLLIAGALMEAIFHSVAL